MTKQAVDQVFLFAAFEAANFQIDFFGNPVMRTAEKLSDATPVIVKNSRPITQYGRLC